MVKSTVFWLPGLCFLILGVGNLFVGHYKGAEYREVYQTLTSSEFKKGEANLPLQRISSDKEVVQRSLNRRSKVKQRTEFYSILFAIGQVLTVVGLILSTTGMIVHQRNALSLSHAK